MQNPQDSALIKVERRVMLLVVAKMAIYGPSLLQYFIRRLGYHVLLPSCSLSIATASHSPGIFIYSTIYLLYLYDLII